MEVKKSKYKGVYHSMSSTRSKLMKEGYWIAQKIHKGKKYQKVCVEERDAALAYDKMCLSLGLEPVNILVPKLN